MPTAERITAQLLTMASELSAVAIAWHLAIGAALIAALLGWRPSSRIACVLAAAPVLSAALAAFAYSNVFNGAVFALLALVLAVLGDGLTQRHVERGPAWSAWLGAALVAFGSCYPHFVAGPWYRVIAAAPVGIVPCPTLAVVSGIVLIAGGFGSRVIPTVLAVAAMFYGMFGMLQLGVAIDVGLLAAVPALIALAIHNPGWLRRPS